MFELNNKTKGFSLLELILAIAIFSIGSFAIATMLIDANLGTKLSTERTEALLFAKEGIEATRSIRDNNWASLTNGVHGLSDSGGTWIFWSSSDLIDNKYTRAVTITEISTSTKNISVNVAWPLTPSRAASVTLETLFSNWRVTAGSTTTSTTTESYCTGNLIADSGQCSLYDNTEEAECNLYWQYPLAKNCSWDGISSCLGVSCIPPIGDPPPCTDFTYSAWSSCVNSLQTREILSSGPGICIGGTPVTSQSCGELAVCTGSSYIPAPGTCSIVVETGELWMCPNLMTALPNPQQCGFDEIGDSCVELYPCTPP